MTSTMELAAAADAAVADTLAAVADQHPAVVVAAPPGAGKSFLATLVAYVTVGKYERSVAVATPTRAQGQELAQRIADTYPGLPVVWFGPQRHPNPSITHVARPGDLPPGPKLVIGTVAKWSFSLDLDPFDLLIVDEAWQVTDAAFARISHASDRYLLVGDPGQIAPVVTADVGEWAGQPDSPASPAPVALMHRHPDRVLTIRLPATRRLGPDTAALVSPAFYRDTPFGSLRPDTRLTIAGGGPLDALNGGTEVIAGLLPADVVPVDDPGMIAAIRTLTMQALDGGTVTRDGHTLPLDKVGIVVPHVSQVVAIRAACHDLPVDVSTVEQYQGRETELILAWHPASGRGEVTDFARDAGRLCVQLSRHTAGCVVLMREDTAETVAAAGAGTGRSLVGEDAGFLGWTAHTTVLRELAARAVQL